MAKTRRMHVVLDLESFVGTMRHVAGSQLPRDDKPQLEQRLANVLLTAIGRIEGVDFIESRINRPDPPDVTSVYGGKTIGIEISELMPSYRLEKDAIIRQLRSDALAQLEIGLHTRDLVFNVSCHDDYAKQFRPGRWVGPLLGQTLSGQVGDRGAVALPPKLQTVVSSVTCFRDANVANNTLVKENEPLILFGAQNTSIDPVADFPSMVAERLDRKCQYRFDRPTWLLLWSWHFSMSGFGPQVGDSLQSYFAQRLSPYHRVFYFHYGGDQLYELGASP